MDNKRPGGSMKQPLGDTPTRSQLLPLQTNWRALLSKGYFWPGMITVIAVVLLFGYLQSDSAYNVVCPCKVLTVTSAGPALEYQNVKVAVPMYLVVLALYITGGLAYGAYRIIGKTAPLWLIPAAGAVTYFLAGGPLLSVAHILDFGVHDLPDHFTPFGIIQAFFAAGLPEEVLKAVPVVLGVWAARSLQKGHLLWGARVVEPLDGILIGVASGLGFTLNETLTQYVPQQIVYAHFQLVSESMASELLIPRVLQNIAGHAAWAGILGYYIGLAAMRATGWQRPALIGLGIAALLHGAWDASGQNGLVELIVAVVSFAMLAGVIMKARELSPHRSQLLRSQVTEAPVAAAAAASASPSAPATGAAATPSAVRPNGVARSQTWGQRSQTWDEAPAVECLVLGNSRFPLTLGARLTESQIPGLKAGAGDGVVAIVNANPEDARMLGLKNLSTATWHVETVGHGARELSTGRSIRIERGVRIQIGDVTATIQ
jgi:RsiW-degrading membrane proteinase PrsW (M82 family)